jgi:hypothetical protein
VFESGGDEEEGFMEIMEPRPEMALACVGIREVLEGMR